MVVLFGLSFYTVGNFKLVVVVLGRSFRVLFVPRPFGTASVDPRLGMMWYNVTRCGSFKCNERF